MEYRAQISAADCVDPHSADKDTSRSAGLE